MTQSLFNLYVGLDTIKAAVDVTGTTYDAVLTGMQLRACRELDALFGGCEFNPSIATRYFDGSGREDQWLFGAYLLEESAITLSADNGHTYEDTLTATDYWKLDGARYDETPTRLLRMNPNGSYGVWFAGRRTVCIAGTWGWRRGYTRAWDNSNDALAANITSSALSCTVSDADGADASGITPRFQVGQLLKIGAEFCHVTGVDVATNTLTLVRGVNGSTATSHITGDVLHIWRAEEVVQQAALMQTVRWFKRGQQAYQDAAGSMDLGKLLYMKKIDPEIELLVLEAGIRDVVI